MSAYGCIGWREVKLDSPRPEGHASRKSCLNTALFLLQTVCFCQLATGFVRMRKHSILWDTGCMKLDNANSP